MAIAEATLCVIEDEHLQEHAARVGGFLLTELEALKAKHPQVIGDVRWVASKGQVHTIEYNYNSKRMNYLSRIRSTKGQIYQDVSAT